MTSEVVGRYLICKAKQEIQSVKDAIAREGQGQHVSPTFLSSQPEEEGIKDLVHTQWR